MNNGGGGKDPALQAAGSFFPAEQIVAVDPFGTGRINDTFLVCLSQSPDSAVLQRINRQVFPSPEVVICNLFLLRSRMDIEKQEGGRLFPAPIRTLTGEKYFCDPGGQYWRALEFIEGEPLAAITSGEQAREVGRLLGDFHSLISAVDYTVLADPLPGFHDTLRYLEIYDQILLNPVRSLESPGARFCRETIERYRPIAHALETARERGFLPTRVMHGDPKLSNILFDIGRRKAMALIDFDTVKAGLLQFDLGDCLRSCCNPVGEDPEEEVVFDASICREILNGYFEAAPGIFSRIEIDFIYPALLLITFELGLRFFTDYLDGDLYFRATTEEANLNRALSQFDLVGKIGRQESEIRGMLEGVGGI